MFRAALDHAERRYHRLVGVVIAVLAAGTASTVTVVLLG